jgi:hypothetical protein
MSMALLLAEPQPETRGFLERHLTNDGFQVVGDGTRPDLVLLGDTAALDACRERHGDVPVIVLGEPESDTVDRVRALDRGCDDFLAKPFDYEELLALVSGYSAYFISCCLGGFAGAFLSRPATAGTRRKAKSALTCPKYAKRAGAPPCGHLGATLGDQLRPLWLMRLDREAKRLLALAVGDRPEAPAPADWRAAPATADCRSGAPASWPRVRAGASSTTPSRPLPRHRPAASLDVPPW